jgi:hypothetical protein
MYWSYLLCFYFIHYLTFIIVPRFGSQLWILLQVKEVWLTERPVTKNLSKGSTGLGSFFYLKIVLHWKLDGVPSPKNRRRLHLRNLFEIAEEEVAEVCRRLQNWWFRYLCARSAVSLGWFNKAGWDRVDMCLTWRKFVRSSGFESLEGRIHLSETFGNGRIIILWWSFALQSSINAGKKGGLRIVSIYLLWMYEHFGRYFVVDVTNIRISWLLMNSFICLPTCMLPIYFNLKIS